MLALPHFRGQVLLAIIGILFAQTSFQTIYLPRSQSVQNWNRQFGGKVRVTAVYCFRLSHQAVCGCHRNPVTRMVFRSIEEASGSLRTGATQG